MAQVDGDRLRQTLWNLVINGAQSMPRGGVVTLSVEPDEPPEGAWIRVSDEGVGIAPADRERVFDPFYSTRSGGTGLGLAVVDQIVRAHGGTISVRARPEGGTEFEIFLPREARVTDG